MSGDRGAGGHLISLAGSDVIAVDRASAEQGLVKTTLFENLKWLTSREAVVYLRLPSEGALRNLVYRRRVPFVRLGRRLRFEREALDRFLESSLKSERRIA